MLIVAVQKMDGAEGWNKNMSYSSSKGRELQEVYVKMQVGLELSVQSKK